MSFFGVDLRDGLPIGLGSIATLSSIQATRLQPSLNLNFLTGTLSPQITFARASSATYFDSTGTLQTAGNNVARFDYNPSTLAAQGLLIEEQRTNSIRNNTMQGAVAGTPGTAPTNWLIPTPSNGLSRQIVGTGTESGINYVDVRYSGTTSAASLTAIYWESATQVAAASGQTWTNSVYVALVGGSTANTTGVVVGIDENSGAGGFLTGSSTTFVPSAGALSGKRVSHTRTLTNASTAFVWPYVFFSYGNGAAIDITLRIGLPQLEQGAFATSVIPTTTAAATRSADVASVNTLTPWYNATEGTLYAQANLISSSYVTGVLVDIGAGGAFGATEYISWVGTAWTLNPNAAPLNVYSAVTTTATAKTAIGIKANDSVISANGLLGTVDTSCAVPVSPTTLSIGRGGWSGAGNYFNGWVQRITYYPVRLANAQLQAITA